MTEPRMDESELTDIIEQAIFETGTGLEAAMLAAERIAAREPTDASLAPGLREALGSLLDAAGLAIWNKDSDAHAALYLEMEQARAALAAAPSAPAGLDVERLARAVVSEFPHITLSGRDMPAAWAAIAAAYESDG